MKNARIICFLAIQFLVAIDTFAQNTLPDKIRISMGRSDNSNYSKKFDNAYFKRELEFDLNDSTFQYRKNVGKGFKPSEIEPSRLFLQPGLYQKLDSLYENFESYRFSGGKFKIYKIELVYSIHEKWSLPAKVKTMVVIVADDPDNVQLEYIEALIKEYHAKIPGNWFSY